MRKVALALAASVAALAVPASACADTALNIVPWGQAEPGASWATQAGVLPAATQALMYDRLTPLFRNVTNAQLVPSTDGSGYFKSEALLAENDPSLISLETVSGTVPGRSGTLSARVRRDAYGVPEVYSDSDDGVVFGAGYVTAEDRYLLLAIARDNAYAAAVDLPGVTTIELVLGGASYTPSPQVVREVDRVQTRAARRAGARGRQLLHDIDTYVAGVNTWLREHQPAVRPFTRADVYALNAFKGQFLGEGGGAEVANDNALAEFQHQMGRRNGYKAYADLRQRDNEDTAVTTTKRFPDQTKVRVKGARGRVALRRGSFVAETPATAATAAASAFAPRREASNALLVTGRRSANGKPIMVAGPQLPYTYPGFTLEMGLYGPHIRTRGVTSAPFPGYMLIGRGTNFAWSLTSAGADIVDTYAERLCGGSTTRYVFRGRCRRMTSLKAGTLVRGSSTSQITIRRTVHGPVIGYAKDAAGHRVALTRKRSSAGRDVLDQLFFQQLTFGRVHSAKQFIRAAGLTPQTFNSFYVSGSQIAFVTTGRLPKRARGVNPDLPVDGRGRFEWRGFLPLKDHPQAINPSSGQLVNWNNKPARGFPAGDARWSEGSVQRSELLTGELARTAKHTPASVTAAMNAAATEDVRIVELWPVLKAVLDHGTAPSPRAAAMEQQLQAWHDAGGSRLDVDLDGRIDAAGAAILDAAWPGMARAAMCGRLGSAGCAVLETRMSVFDQPPGGQYGGWQQYLDQDLRRLLGQKERSPYHLRYCGKGSLARCSAGLWAALDSAGAALAAAQGEDPAAWREPAERVSFRPLPLTEIRYANRPSGIQQVIQFGG